jgi:fatty acid desaturase
VDDLTHEDEPSRLIPRRRGNFLERRQRMAIILWIIAAVLVISGIFAIVRQQLLWGIVLIVVGLLVGPGGVSIFH